MEPKLAESSSVSLMELDIGDSTESFQRFLESQRELFHSQIDQLQNIVVAQCKLTGVNPLSQEMAAGALSVKIGKRPRDLLNPKAVEYMQSVFSIKDTISKKDTREIGALCGVSATQVRDFFAGQRSRVRKFVRLSREKAIKLNTCKTYGDVCLDKPAADMVVCSQDPVHTTDLKFVKTEEDQKDIKAEEISKDVKSEESLKDVKEEEPTSQEENLPGLDSSEKNFVENIFRFMEKEETFCGQVKLIEWVLRVQSLAVLNWFISKGGVMLLATWLSQAATEEQTTVLLVILKVLCHLPLHKALPVQMSAILQTVNKLRFYRTSDISNRAKVLLSRWSKLFVRSQAMKKPSPSKALSDAQKEIMRKQRISQILSHESWQSKIDIPEEILALTYDGLESSRTPDTTGLLKLLPAPSSDSNKKSFGSVSYSYTKERRKVLLVESPDFKTAGRSSPPARLAQANNSRPLSADDIQKAKMRAIYMKTKLGKLDITSKGSRERTTKNLKKCEDTRFSSSNSDVAKMSLSETTDLSKGEGGKPISVSSQGTLTVPGIHLDLRAQSPPQHSDLGPCLLPNKLTSGRSLLSQEINATSFSPASEMEGTSALKEQLATDSCSRSNLASEKFDSRTISVPKNSDNNFDLSSSSALQAALLKKLNKSQIPWCMPPEMRISSLWSMGYGENSKEVEVQTQRIRREKETIYYSVSEIPSDPKEPWDVEMDFEDSLMPEIPTEQPPEVDTTEATSGSGSCGQSISSSATAKNSHPEPDLELLAVLLKNPDLVFALTSGQASNIPNTQMVQVLDMLKASGMGMSELLNGTRHNGPEAVKPALNQTPVSLPSPTPASLPSPTPPSDPAKRWELDPAPATAVMENTVVSTVPSVPPNLVFHRAPSGRAGPEFPAGASRLPEKLPSSTTLLPQSPAATSWPKQFPPSVPSPRRSELNAGVPRDHIRLPSSPFVNGIADSQSTVVKPAPVSIVINHPPTDRRVNSFLLPQSAKNAYMPQSARSGEPPPYPVGHASLPRNSSGTGNLQHMPNPTYIRPYNFLDKHAQEPNFMARQSTFAGGVSGPGIPLQQASSEWNGPDYMGEPGFESWSPERDLSSGWSIRGGNGRINNGNPQWWRSNSGHHQGHRSGSRKWRGRR